MLSGSYSLEGEDRLALSLLRSVAKGTYLDIGCADPIEISNTYLFYERGWRGVAVDGRDDVSAAWAYHRSEDKFCCSLVGEHAGIIEYYRFPDGTLNTCDASTASRYADRFSSTEIIREVREVRSARSIWQETMGEGHPPPHLVSIDVEGYELQIIRGLIDKNFRPPLMIIETKLFDFSAPSSHPIVRHMSQHGYSLIAKTPLDCFFIDGCSEIFSWLPEKMRSVQITSTA